MPQPHTADGLLFVAVAALLLAPLVFMVALVNLAGPATRAALAGEEPSEPYTPVAPVVSGSEPGRPDDPPTPLTGNGADDAALSGELTPIFEPRIGRFRLDAAIPADDGHEHAGPHDGAAGDEQAGEWRQLAARSPSGADRATGPTQASPVATPWPAGPPRASAELPILMFHYTGPLPADPDVFRRDLTVSPALFERQLATFADSGIETVTLDRLFEHLEGRRPLPPRAVALTFDDGYVDNYEVAFPLLKEHGMVGTFFVTTGFIGRPGYMTWEQLEEMAAAGMAIEAHSVSHADLTQVAPEQLARELAQPKRELEARLGRPCRFLAFPGGRFDPSVIRATKAAGYTAAVTTQHGLRHTGAGPFELTRVRVRGTETVEQLVAKLTPPGWRALARTP